MKQPYVSTLIEQNFTSGEKARARENIDAISSADLADYATHDWVEDQGYLTSADIPSSIPEASANQFLASDQLGNMEWKSLKLIDDRVQAGAYINLERQEYPDHVETTINCTGLQPSGDYVETSAIADMATQTWVNDQNYITSADVPPQIEYSAGPNIDIYNHIISTEKPRVEAGTNVSVNSVLDPQTRVITYTISAADTTYTAGSNVQISSGNVISATDTTYGLFNTTTDGLAPKASSTGDGAKFLRGDCTWQAPMTGVDGDANHPNYISVDAYGNLQYAKTKRLFWEFTFHEPSVELTATDIANGFVELVFPLGADGLGLGIMNNGNMVCMKGYSIEMGNSLNGRQLSFYILAHNGTSPRWLMDTGFTTYTESVVNNYDWKAFKAIGLCADRNASLVDAVLRVPLNTETAGQTFKIPGYVCVSVFGVASGD